MSEIRVWFDDPADGLTNMAADEVLAAESVRQGFPLVRFYGWNKLTFSLGGFQPLAQARAEPSITALPFVRRPSGGGGIIHGTDLTYAVAVPRTHAWGGRPQVLYDTFHESLASVLTTRGIPARLHEGRGPKTGDEHRLFCFERRSRGDLVVAGSSEDGFKILGSAQRRLSAAVLQHGSLLLDTPRWGEYTTNYPGLGDIFPAVRQWSREGLIADWLAQLARSAGLVSTVAMTPFRREHDAEIAVVSSRFAAPEWLSRR